MGKTQKPDDLVTVPLMMPLKMRKWLDEQAKREDRSRSHVVRGIIRDAQRSDREVLDDIGEDFVKEYFGLVTPEDLEKE